jgi:predicted RNA-binding protein with PUA-like domain
MGRWLMKSEPGVYSIDDLKRDGKTCWEGVRNYQARNFMRDSMKKGDLVLFYHSNAEPPGVAGIAEVVREGYPDEERPWVRVDMKFKERFAEIVPLEALKRSARLKGMAVTQRGSRLSVQPVSGPHFKTVVEMGRSA